MTKTTPTGITSVIITYVYDLEGEVAAEYSSGAPAAPCTTCYLMADHLGSTRMMTNSSATVVALHDYLPFGEEIPSNIDGRDGTWSGTDPQSWNLYSYVGNNPLKYIDESGHGKVSAFYGAYSMGCNESETGRNESTWRELLPPRVLEGQQAMIDRTDEPALHAAGLAATHTRGRIWPIIRVAAGNCLEMYDFQIFGYYAIPIALTFFPSNNEYASLLASLATFGAGFLMRPLGALVLGAYVDHRGRRAGLLLTLSLMALGTLSIACTPSFATIGLLAPLIVLLGRLVQGLSAGAENGGVSVYLSEIATSGRKGFYVSWQTASQQVGVMSAALLGMLLTAYIPKQAMVQWGWRIPLLVGCSIIPLLFFLRRSLEETQTFLERKHHLTLRQVVRTLVANWRIVLLGIMLVTPTTVLYYMITAYTPTFGSAVLHLGYNETMLVTLCVGASNLVWLPIMGSVSDRLGRRPILAGITALILLTAYPALWWLSNSPSFSKLLTTELWLSFLFGSYTGAMVVFLTEMMPPEVRTTGFSFAYSCATAAFGGFTPAICTFLIHTTGNPAVPGLWVSFAAACGLIASVLTSPAMRC